MTAHSENPASTLPDVEWYNTVMSAHGFRTVVEKHLPIPDAKGVKRQRLIYYGQKVTESYVTHPHPVPAIRSPATA